MSRFRDDRLRCALLAVALSSVAGAQAPDPANLTGERVAPQSLADTLPINHGAPALAQLLLKLRTRASMMLIVAHPDDEDGGLLTYESRGAGARVAMLTLTRGEGGQNLMSADFGDALGLIRTQELLAADRYMGVDQYFGTEVDFGFSKTKEESFKKWTHDRVLYDAVRAIRLYRPLVIASVFVGGVTDGHGHHQVAGEIAQEAFVAAADPSIFPDMGLPPWAPLKVYARVPFSRVTASGMYDYATGRTVPTRFQNYVTGVVSTTPPTPTVLIHEGDPATLLRPDGTRIPTPGMDGLSYIQFARKGLALQKTQIGPNARLAPPGTFDVGYTLMASRVCGSPTSSTPSASTTPSSSKPLGSTGLQVRVSTSSATNRASAPGVCSSSTSEQSLFDGIDTSLPSLTGLVPTRMPKRIEFEGHTPYSAQKDLQLTLEGIDQQLAEAQRLFKPASPSLTVPPLDRALKSLDSLIAAIPNASFAVYEKPSLLRELRIKRTQLNNALLLALGVTLEGHVVGTSPLTPGERYTVQAQSSLPANVTNPNLQLRLTEGKGSTTSAVGRAVATEPQIFSTQVAASAPPTKPYFRQPDAEQAFYTLDDPALRNAPQSPPPLNLLLTVMYQGTQLNLIQPVSVAAPQLGVLSQPAVIVPAVSVSLMPQTGIVPLDATSFKLSTLTNTSAPGTVTLKTPAGWTTDRGPMLETKRGKLESFTITAGRLVPNQPYTLTAVASAAGHDYTESFRPVGYPGLTTTNLYTPATYRATAVDVATAPNLHIAYLPGTGDDVPSFLPSLGVTPTLISPANLKDLTKFDAVLLGVRAYAAHPELAGQGSQPLLDYARAGGIVIVQYNTARYGPSESPYPISVPGDPSHNVVVEEQPVTLLAPSAPLLNWPNRITSADFNNWVEERGHGFAASWDPHFQPLLETHDPDQDPQRGGLLLAPVGRGAYVYCALALYRQLPEGVPGAYRLLANLLSYSKNPTRKPEGTP